MAGVFTHNGNIVEGLPSNANMINYDNTNSGMTATQMQAAVDELNANKQSKIDNNLTTTSKETTGAINELKSGLTNVADDVKLNTQDLTTPSRTKNVLPMTLAGIKSLNTLGTWSGNAYTYRNTTITVLTDNDDNVIGFNIDGTVGSGGVTFYIINNVAIPYNGTYKFTTTNGLGNGVAVLDYVFSDTSQHTEVYTQNITKEISSNLTDLHIYLWGGRTFDNIIMQPMMMLSTESDATFAPYIPSVDARLDAVESGLANCVKTVKLNIGSSGATQSIPLDKSKIYDIEVSVANNASVYNYYHWFAMYGQSSWITAEISKVEQSTTNVALTYTIDSSNNLVVTNSGNWGATGVIKIATVDK